MLAPSPCQPFAALFLACVVCAQDPAPPAPPARVSGATLGNPVPELEPLLLDLAERAKKEGASWPVPRLSWTTLALAANGSTLRTGPLRDGQKVCATILRGNQGEHGRFVVAGGEFDRTEHVLATFAMARMQIESNYKLLRPTAVNGVNAALAAFAGDDAKPATTDEVALLAMLAETLKDPALAELQPAVVDLARRGAEALPANVSRRDDAVRHLTGVLLGEQHAPDFTIAQCWPGNLSADPLHTWIAAFVVRSMPERLREQQLEHARSLLARRTTEGGWPADEALDDVTRTAMFAGVLGMLSPKPIETATEGR